MGFTGPGQRAVHLILDRYREEGQTWLDRLPALVAEVARGWELDIGPPFATAWFSYVAPAARADGTPAVLKVSPDRPAARREADALQHWGGRGAVRLLAADRERGVLLMERAKPGVPLEQRRLEPDGPSIAAGVLRGLWSAPTQARHHFPTTHSVAERLADEIPDRLARRGRTFDAMLVAEAIELCQSFARPVARPVLLHGDAHVGNVLAASREPWLAVDPNPHVGDPAFDTAPVIRSLMPDTPTREQALALVHSLAAEQDLDPDAVRGWALIRHVVAMGAPHPEADEACARALAT